MEILNLHQLYWHKNKLTGATNLFRVKLNSSTLIILSTKAESDTVNYKYPQYIIYRSSLAWDFLTYSWYEATTITSGKVTPTNDKNNLAIPS